VGKRDFSIREYGAYSLEYALACCAEKSDNRDNRSKEWIYKKYYGYLMGIAIRYVKCREDAEEVVNESFVKIFKNLVHFSGGNNALQLEKIFKGWIAKICVNLSIDFLRSKKMLFEDVDEIQDLSWAHYDTSSKMDAEDIMKLLNQLSSIQAAIFNLFEIEGYSHEEISQMLEIPESTSRAYLTRAKQKLREMYLERFTVPKL